MRIDEIAKGEVIEIEARCDEETIKFKSEVSDIINQSILVRAIKVEDQSIGFTGHCRTSIIYIQDSKVTLWENAVIRLVKYNNEIYHMIKAEGEGKSYNRRASYRIYIGEEMQIFLITDHGTAAISALIKDISETGVAFITKEEFEINCLIMLKLIDNSSMIHLSGIIIRKEYCEAIGSFLYGCKITGSNSRLNKYISKKQSELLQRKSPTPSEPLTPPSKNNREKRKEDITAKR